MVSAKCTRMPRALADLNIYGTRRPIYCLNRKLHAALPVPPAKPVVARWLD